MRNASLLLCLCLFLFCACQTAQRATRQGHYDQAISLSVKKLQRKRTNTKEIALLERNFAVANQRDLRDIEFLKNRNVSSDAGKIFLLYQQIRQRQESIRPLLPLYHSTAKREAVFAFVDIDQALIASKDAALDYYYKKGELYLAKQDRFNAREAYGFFQKVSRIDPDYRDVEQLQAQAFQLGQNYVLVNMLNEARVVMPDDFEEQLLSLTTGDLKTEWTQFHSRRRNDITYSHRIQIRLQRIEVTPGLEKRRDYVHEKELEERIPVKDAQGHILKDSLGKEVVQVVRTKIRCKVMEVEQRKGANISGTVEFYDRESQQVMHREPVSSTMLWQHFYAQSRGDIRALTPETRRLLENRPMNFPPDLLILQGAGENLKPRVKLAIADHYDWVR